MNNQNAAVTPLALPEENVNRVVAMVNDPASKPSLRVGMQATVTLELSGPPKDNEAFSKAITDSLNAKLKANGMTPGQGGPVWFIVHVEEKDTGRKVDYREFGDSHSPARAGRSPSRTWSATCSSPTARAGSPWPPADLRPAPGLPADLPAAAG